MKKLVYFVLAFGFTATTLEASFSESIKNKAALLSKNREDRYRKAIWRRDLLSIRAILINPGINPDLSDYDESTALMKAACFSKGTNVVKLLLEHGANPNIKDNDGLTALMFAAGHGCTASVKLLLEYGADPLAQIPTDYFLGGSALVCAACANELRNNSEIFKLILAWMIRKNLIPDVDGNTALHLAAHYNRPDLVAKYLPKKPTPQN